MQTFIRVLYQSTFRKPSSRYCVVCCCKRSAFTLIELLATVAIVGVLVGLLFPAVNAIRESARRSSCQNNLRQVAFAALNFESGHMHFPTGQVGPSDTDGNGRLDFVENQLLGHLWFLLPNLEQAEFANQFELGPVNVNSGGPAWHENNDNLQASDHSISVFRCPSDASSFAPTRLTVSSFRVAGVGPVFNSLVVENTYEGWTNYLGSQGNRVPNNDVKRNGVFLQRTEVSPQMISDGLSNTIFFGELIGAVHGNGRVAARASIFDSGVTTSALFSQSESVDDSQAIPIFSSYHASGDMVNFAFADGHVVAVSSSGNSGAPLQTLFSIDGQDLQ